MNDFFDAVRRFLLDYLPKQRCLSENTILSYRQTLNIFVAYMRDEMGIGATELTFSRIDRDVILSFLTWLENVRGCSAQSFQTERPAESCVHDPHVRYCCPMR